MTTLDEAWEWYRATAEGMKRLRHLSAHWGLMPDRGENQWVDRLLNDRVLGLLEPGKMSSDAEAVGEPLDDLAVLVLFSVFEANVRDLVHEQIRPEVAHLEHVFLKRTGEDALQRVTEGSFFQVLEPFKSVATIDIIEKVNQIRQFRNWVAHGRRPLPPGKQLPEVKPKEAYGRLKDFLDLVRPALPLDISGKND